MDPGRAAAPGPCQSHLTKTSAKPVVATWMLNSRPESGAFPAISRVGSALKSVAPKDVTLREIFVSVLPFIVLRIIGLVLVTMFPRIALWLPGKPGR